MSRTRIAVLVIALLGALAVALPASARTTTVTVTAARPSEFHFTLSKSTVLKGTVVFKVTNKGTIPHDFKIAGRKTALIQPGKTATLRVIFRKAGRFTYMCTVSGHAAAGMKGVLRVK
ncbi:MAG: cupredoxin domain-containing protein [Gaiellaceae bacterium]